MANTRELMPVAILAGGLATRLRPVTTTTPKALVEVAGEPFVVHQLRLLASRGLTDVVLCVGYLGEMIRERIGDGADFGVNVQYSFDGPQLLGTAGAIRNALPTLGSEFFIMYGDSYLECDYRAIAAAFRASGRSALMAVYRNNGDYDMSNVEYAGGEIRRYEKRNRTPQMQHIDYGLGVFRSKPFLGLPAAEPADLAELYRSLLEQGELAAFEVSTRFYEIGSPEGLRETQEYLLKQIVIRPSSSGGAV